MSREVDVETWQQILDRATSQILMSKIEAVVKRGAVNVKRDWIANAKATSGQHAPAYPYSIGFDDPARTGSEVTAVVGPDKDKTQGALGNLLEYGSRNNPPHNDGLRAVEKERPRFADALGDVCVGMLL